MNDGGKIIKNCIEYARQADIQNGEMNKNCYQCTLEWLQKEREE